MAEPDGDALAQDLSIAQGERRAVLHDVADAATVALRLLKPEVFQLVLGSTNKGPCLLRDGV